MASVGRWKSKIGTQELGALHSYVGPTLRELGYEVDPWVPPTPATMLRRRWIRGQFAFRRVLARRSWLRRYSSVSFELGKS